MNTLSTSRIVRAMNRLSLVLLLSLLTALPAAAQSTEFGILAGASRRFVEDAPRDADDAFLDSDFSLENGTVDLYWALQLEPDTFFKLKAGRIETQVPYVTGEDAEGRDIRRDAEGEVQHVEALVEYRFPEAFGSSGLFGGVGMYRHSSDASDATTSWGLTGGVNADFPLSRRYGILVEAAYHWTQADFGPRYLTLGAGLRIAF